MANPQFQTIVQRLMAGDAAGAQAIYNDAIDLTRRHTLAAASQADKTFLGQYDSLWNQLAEIYNRWRVRKVRDWRRITVPLTSTLLVGTTGGNDKWQVNSDEAFFVEEIRGTVRMNDVSAETLAIANIGNPGLLDRMLLKGMNCRASLQISDTTIPYFENSKTLSIADIMPAAGGEPLIFQSPDLVPPGHSLKAQFDLQDTAADVVGASTDYGLLITGIAIKITR